MGTKTFVIQNMIPNLHYILNSRDCTTFRNYFSTTKGLHTSINTSNRNCWNRREFDLFYIPMGNLLWKTIIAGFIPAIIVSSGDYIIAGIKAQFNFKLPAVLKYLYYTVMFIGCLNKNWHCYKHFINAIDSITKLKYHYDHKVKNVTNLREKHLLAVYVIRI